MPVILDGAVRIMMLHVARVRHYLIQTKGYALTSNPLVPAIQRYILRIDIEKMGKHCEQSTKE
jgi:hypothetical protein